VGGGMIFTFYKAMGYKVRTVLIYTHVLSVSSVE